MLSVDQTHTCHAKKCGVPVKPELLMCAYHWKKVPLAIKQAVWRHYRPGQCDDKNPSREWYDAADAAIEAVAKKEGLMTKKQQKSEAIVSQSIQKRQLPLFTPQNTEIELVRLNKPVNGSMSKTDLLLQCQYWASPTVTTVPESTEISSLNYALRFGRGFHKCMEIHLESRGLKKPKFAVIAKRFSVEAERLEQFYWRARTYIDKLLKDRRWDAEERLVERKMVYDPFADKMRFLTSTKERDYSDRRSTELPGTGDLAVIPRGKRFMVLDWKSGSSFYTAQDNGQLLSLALGLSRFLEFYEADVFIIRIDDDFIEPSEGVLTYKHLEEHRERLRDAIKNALSLNPSMRLGTHCFKFYCPAIEVCPAHAGPLSLRDAVEGVLTPEQRGHQYTRYQGAKKLIEKLGDFWHRDVENNGAITLDTGQEVYLRPVEKENLSKASIRRAFNPVDAEKKIDELRNAGAIEEIAYTQLNIRNRPDSRK